MARTSTARRSQSPKSYLASHSARARRRDGSIKEQEPDVSWPGYYERRVKRMAVLTLAEGVADTVDWRPPRAYRNSLTSRWREKVAKWEREARRREAEWRRQDAALLASMPAAPDENDDDIIVAARELGIELPPLTPPDPRFARMAEARVIRAGDYMRGLAARQAGVAVKPRVVLPPHLRVPEDEEHRATSYKGGRTRHQQARLLTGRGV